MLERFFNSVLVLVLASAIALHAAQDGDGGPEFYMVDGALKASTPRLVGPLGRSVP